MTEDEKRRFDALESQRKGHYDSFDQRRAYEWKLSFGLWTAMAAFIATLVTQPVPQGQQLPISGPVARWVVVIVAALLVFVHTKFLIGMGRANNADRLMSWHFEREMRDKILKLPFDAKLEAELSALRSKMGRIKNWSYFSQFAITALLATACVLAMIART